MIEAINKVGPNRFRVRDYLAGLEEWDGVTGHMIFDGRWDNIVPISIAEYNRASGISNPAPELKKSEQAKADPK